VRGSWKATWLLEGRSEVGENKECMNSSCLHVCVARLAIVTDYTHHVTWEGAGSNLPRRPFQLLVNRTSTQRTGSGFFLFRISI
jgi:hypothetical protein